MTTRLKEASDNEGKKLQAFNQTFNEIIKRDKNFGSLLLKIKQSYDEYIRKCSQQLSSQVNSPLVSPNAAQHDHSRMEDMQNQVRALEMDLKA